MKQCFGYVRVSTVKQGEGVSLEAQREAIEHYAARREIKITRWFEEKVTAAKKGRPLFNQMVSDLKRRKADGVIFHKIDRSARNFTDWARIGDLAEAGIDIHFSTETLDFRSRGGRLTADIQAVIAADYVRNLREESIKGQVGRLKQGLYPYTAPVGYLDMGKGKAKKIDPTKSRLIKSLFELYATSNHSYDTLTVEMDARGLTNTSGRPLTKTGIENVLTNPFYMGIIRIRQSGKTYSGIHKPIISAQLYEKTEDVRSGRRRKIKVMHKHLFRGLFTCGHCGRSMTGEIQRGHTYYRCHKRNCLTMTVREEQLGSVIEQHIAKVVLSDEKIGTLRTRLVAWLNERDSSAVDASAPMELAKVKTRLSNLTDKYVDDYIDHETYQAKREKLLREQKKWEQLCSKRQRLDVILLRLDTMFEHVKSLYNDYVSANSERKRELAQFASSNMRVFGRNVEIETPKWYRQVKDALSAQACPLAPSPFRTIQALEEVIKNFEDVRTGNNEEL